MVARKRRHEEMDAKENGTTVSEPSLLSRIRKTWEFANLMQYIYIFGKAVKIDQNVDIEVRQGLLAHISQSLSRNLI